MLLKFDFIPHKINNIFQNIKHPTSFSKHLLTASNNNNLWQNLIAIDPYSLNINKNGSINIVIDILLLLKHYVPFYSERHILKEKEIEEIKNYDILLIYLQDRLKNGTKINNKHIKYY